MLKDLLWRSCEAGIISEIIVLHWKQHSVAFLTTFIEIVLLKIERYLRKPISVKEIMDSICNVEGIHTCSIKIACRILRCVHWIVEIKGSRALRGSGACIPLVGNNVVAPSTRCFILAFDTPGYNRDTHSVVVVLVVDTLCQPGQFIMEGDATLSSGSVSTWNPSGGTAAPGVGRTVY